jgi:hypothetical protein
MKRNRGYLMKANPTPASPEAFLPDCGPKLVATRLPPDLAREVEAAAAKELLSVASYCRRAIADAVRGRQSQERTVQHAA